jgi:hypothetical protein
MMTGKTKSVFVAKQRLNHGEARLGLADVAEALAGPALAFPLFLVPGALRAAGKRGQGDHQSPRRQAGFR